MRQMHNDGSGGASLNKADNWDFSNVLLFLLNRIFKNNYATFVVFVINTIFLKGFTNNMKGVLK